MDWVAFGNRLHYQGVPDLVVGDDRLFLWGYHPAPLLRAGHHPQAGFLELLGADRAQAAASRQDGGFVEKIGEVGSGEARGLASDHIQVDVGRQRLVLRVETQYGSAPVQVGGVD